MYRSKKILIVCHCLLNSNAKVYPLANCGGVYSQVVGKSIEKGIGLLQLPCPETVYLGINRWGMTREQYDNPTFRDCCRQILIPSIAQIQGFASAGYQIIGVIGMDGSPNCGVNRTCHGFSGGEISTEGIVEAQRNCLEFRPGRGVFMEVLSTMLDEVHLDISFSAIDEEVSLS
jgi:predicted secreted protein